MSTQGSYLIMADVVEIKLPKLGESILSATVIQWMKKEGDRVELDEPLLEVATDKVNSEIPSPVAGILQKILVKVDAEIEIGTPLALVAIGEGKASTSPEETEHDVEKSGHLTSAKAATSGFLSPAVLRLARERGLPLDELEEIAGTGQGGRVTKHDLENYLLARGQRAAKAPKSAPTASSGGAGVERIKMSPMRKAIADNMVNSYYQAPHAFIVSEVDVTKILKRIVDEKESFQEKHGCKLTITAFVIAAVAHALKEFPLINASLDKDTILAKKSINMGLAVNVDDGLMVPVIKNCQERDLVSIAQAIGELSKKAREGKLKPDDVMDGTITVTNFGMSGALIGLPIIRYPEAAIIGVGTIRKGVAVLENETFAVRSTVHVTLAFDHRIVDGMYAASFLNAVKHSLEHP